MSESEFDFSGIEDIRIPFKVKDREGVIKNYLLIEASMSAEIKYRNFIQDCVKYDTAGKASGVKNLADAEPLLLSHCVVEATDEGEILLKNGKEVYVPESVIKSWKSVVTKKLYRKALEISSLNKQNPPEKQALVAALAREDSPVNAQVFNDWLLTLEGPEYAAIRVWAETEVEDELKN